MPETETKRLFVAIFPPAGIVTGLQAAVAGLAREIPARAIRWTRPEQVHLTLNFLGAIELARIPEIKAAVRAACNGHTPHKVRAAGLGCFPNESRPQIIWAGLVGELRRLQRLKEEMDARLLACGCAGEDRPFRPHLTIGRVSKLNGAVRKQVTEALLRERNRDFGEWQVARVDLMESTLLPQGAVYDTLESIPLNLPPASV
jgi:2'-5' RNA ligase